MKKGPQAYMAEMAMKQMMKGMGQQGAGGAAKWVCPCPCPCDV
jgi:hypothetical protein